MGELTVFCGALVGSSLGFLWYNAHPAEVFMGDVGSLALGGSIGMIAVAIKQEILLFFVGGVFVLEALSVILQVLSFRLTGKRIFRMSPLHHHFELGGLERIEDHRALLDLGAGVCAVFADDAEIEVAHLKPAIELAGKKVLVVGLARTGIATALFCAERGAQVTATEERSEEQIAETAAKLRAAGVTLELGGHRPETFSDQDLIVPSPGVPPTWRLLPRRMRHRRSGVERNRIGLALSARAP